jgi:tetratricopeptide (TPR) repeat protein
MQKRILFFLFLFLTIPTLFAQQDGFWDKDRATNREIIVNARDRIVVKSESLPIGTTEIVYRITVLDENQQLANSLASVLKAIPDPTGISQGSAGALFLLSKVSGDDRCKYAIYTNPTQANAFKENGKIDAACLYQNNPVNKDAKVLSTDKSACLQSNPTYLWFAFESDNWILNQKIILEIVPWVDTKLSRGWHLQNRKKVINYCKTTATAKGLQNPDEYCVCMLDKIQKEYKFQEFQTLMDIEKNNVLKKNASQCLVESGANTSMNSNLRSQAALLAKQGKYGEAINKLNAIIQTNTATVSDYNNIGSYYLYTKQYDKAVKFLKEGERFDDSELLIKLNLAHAYLLNDNYREAKIIYKKYQTQNVTDSLSWTDKIKLDFEAFQKAGIQNDDYKRVLKLIEK